MPPEAGAGRASRHAAPRAQRSALPFIVFSFVAEEGSVSTGWRRLGRVEAYESVRERVLAVR
jgi:hypothetical protein